MLNSYGFFIVTFYKFEQAFVKFESLSNGVKNVSLSVMNGFRISCKYLVFKNSIFSDSIIIILSSKSFADNIIDRAFVLSFEFIFSVKSYGTGP